MALFNYPGKWYGQSLMVISSIRLHKRCPRLWYLELTNTSTTDLQSAVEHHVQTWGYKLSRVKFIFICFCFFMVFKIYKWKSVLAETRNPHKEMTVDEVIFSLSWAPSTSNFTSFNDSSSAQHSLVRLNQPRAQYCVGDTLNVLVEMRNYAGHPKAYGGDFILARIHSPELEASASGHITDFQNGSYRVQFRLFWPGEVQVSVLLIHSSEAVKILQRDWMQDYNKITHIGTFIKGEKEEKSQCALRMRSNRPLCEYRKKEDGEYYACYRPKTLPCNSLTIMQSSYYQSDPKLTKEEAQLLAKENTGLEIENGFNPVTVVGCTGALHRPTEKCAAGMNSPFPGGYFHSKRWSSFFCQMGPFLSKVTVQRCLKRKTLYLLGDSTARQWMEYLTRLNVVKIVYGSRFDSYFAHDADSKITVRWIKHSHPWLSNFPSNIKTSVTIPQVLDRIAVGGRRKDVIVVIGIGQHFRPYPPEVFIRRLQNIRRAILRLHAHSPQTVVVIKLENSIALKSSMISDSNWYGYIQNLAQRKVFEDLNVALVDAWDMTIAANTFNVHPNDIIVSNQVALALSFSCH